MKAPLRLIPKKLRHALYRKSVSRDFSAANDLTFKIADTQDELEQAFRLSYQVYVSKDLIAPHSSALKLSKVYALPTSKVLIAISSEKVVGVLCVSLESSFRSSCEEHFDLGSLKTKGRSFVELSDFVVDSNYKDRNSVAFPLFKFAIELNKHFFKAESFVMAIPSVEFDFWSSILMLNFLAEKKIDRNLTSCAFTDIGQLEAKFQMIFGKKKGAHNIFRYLYVQSDARVQLPSAEAWAAKYAPHVLNYFFNIKTDHFAHLTSFERRTIEKIYSGEEYIDVLPKKLGRSQFDNDRNSRRFQTTLSARMSLGENKFVTMTIKTISMGGVGAICEEKLNVEKTYRMDIELNKDLKLSLLVSPVWSSRDHTYGFVIRKPSPEWLSFVEAFQSQTQRAS